MTRLLAYFESQQHPDMNETVQKVKGALEEEMKKISKHYEEIDRLRSYLNGKVETVEQMELENLETHLILE